MLECFHFSPTAESLCDDAKGIVVGALLKCFAPLSVDCVLTHIL